MEDKRQLPLTEDTPDPGRRNSDQFPGVDTGDFPAAKYDDQLAIENGASECPDLQPEFAATLRLLHHALRVVPMDQSTDARAILNGDRTLPLQQDPSGKLQGPADTDERVFPALPERFICIQHLGKGAFGSVYLADDLLLQRQVAIKVPNAAALQMAGFRERFLREGRAHARLNHPNIVRVLDAGADHNLLWQVTEFVPGVTLKAELERCSGKLPFHVAAKIAWSLADAVQHAHQEGVLHRDIKPENVIVERSDDADLPENGSRMTPRLTDFGLARLLDDATELSRAGELIGTPRYMAPEQITGNVADIDARTDVYSLGVVLYELLTGCVPFADADNLPKQLMMKTSKVPKLRSVRSDVPRDLESICLKCLSISPAKRYQSAGELRDDLGRYLGSRPTIARPTPMHEQLQLWARRNPSIASLVTLLSLSAVLLIWQSWRRTVETTHKNLQLVQASKQLEAEVLKSEELLRVARESSRIAQLRQHEYQELAWQSTAQNALGCLRQADFLQARELMNRLGNEQPATEIRPEMALIQSELSRRFRVVFDAGYPLHEMAAVPGTDLVVVAGESSVITILDVGRGKIRQTINTLIPSIHALAVSHDGEWITAGGTVDASDRSIPVVLSRITGETLYTLPSQETTIEALAFSPDGTKVVCGPRYLPVQVFDISRKEVSTFSIPSERRNEWFAFCSHTNQLAVLETSTTVSWTDLITGKQVSESRFPDGRSHGVTLPGTDLLACARYNEFGAEVIQRSTNRLLGTLKHSGKPFLCLAACGQTRRVYGGRIDGTLVSWLLPASWLGVTADDSVDEDSDSAGVEPEFVGRFHWQPISAIVCRDESVLCCSRDGTITEVFTGPLLLNNTLASATQTSTTATAIEPQSGNVLSSNSDGQVTWQFDTNKNSENHLQRTLLKVSPSHHGLITKLAFSPPSDEVAMVTDNNTLLTAKTAEPEQLQVFVNKVPLHDAGVNFLHYSHDGRWIVWGGSDEETIWMADRRNRNNVREIRLPRVPLCAAFSPDDSLLAVGSRGSDLVVIQLSDMTSVKEFEECRECTAVCWESDGSAVLAGFADGSIRRLSMSERPDPKWFVHRSKVRQMQLLENSELAVSVDNAVDVAVWNRRTGEPLGVLFSGTSPQSYQTRTVPTLEILSNGILVLAFDDPQRGIQCLSWHLR